MPTLGFPSRGETLYIRVSAPRGCCDGQWLEGGHDTEGGAERTAFIDPE